MAKNIKHIQHLRSNEVVNGKPKAPAASVLLDGEIAINYAEGKETIFVKSSNGTDVKAFSNDDNFYFKSDIDDTVSGILDDIEAVSGAVDDLSGASDDRFDAVESALTAEKNRAISAETALTQAISNEETRAKNAESGLSDAIDAEETRAKNAESGLSDAIDDEEERAKAAESALSEDISDEETRAKNAESALTEAIQTESGRAYSAETALSKSISDEHTRAISAETDLHNEVVAESGRASGVEASLANDISALQTGKSDTGHSHVIGDVINLQAALDGKSNTGHTHGANEVNKMTGYVKPTSTSAITSNDTLNQAIGKLEQALDGKQPIGDYVDTNTYTSYTSTTNTTINSKAASATTPTTASYNSVDKKIYFKNTAGTTLTNMTIDASAFIKDGMIDTVEIKNVPYEGETQPCLVITWNTDAEKETTVIPLKDIFNPSEYYTKLETSSKTQISDALAGKSNTGHTHVSSNVTGMNGYSKPNSTSAIVTGDTLNQAIGKLEKALDGKQASGSYASATHNHDGVYSPIGHTHNYAGSASAGGPATSALSVDWANVKSKPFNYTAQTGQPTYLWGTNNGSDYYVWNPSGFSVNYATSAGSVARATFGDNGNGEHNANNIASNGLWYYTSNGPTTGQGASTTDGALYSQAYSTSWVGQIAQDYRNGRLFVRGKNNGTWTSWLNIIDSGNIGSQSVKYATSAGSATDSTKLPLSGGTMSGTLNTYNGSSDTPLTVKSYNTSGAWIGFNLSNGTTVGYYGIKSDNLPYFYSGSAKRIALLSETLTPASSNRPGVTKLYRRDDNSAYNVQTDWTGTYWRLRGYNGDTFHAECQVGYATSAGSAPASDVYAWAKASTKPSYTLDEVGDGSTRKLANYSLTSHTHDYRYLTDVGGTYTSAIYSIACKGMFSGNNMSDAPVQGWVSGLVMGSNWNNSHYQHYLVEGGDRWYTTRTYSNSKMTNWYTFAYTSDIPTKVSQLTNDSGFITGVTVNGTFWGNSWSNGGTLTGPLTASCITTNTNDVWSDGTNSHVWYGYDHRYANTGVYSTTLSDYFGMTLRTASAVLSMTSGGAIGINTFSPSNSYKLHVNGDTCLSGSAIINSSAFLNGPGSGTYNKSALFSNASGLTIETPKATDANTGTILPLRVTTRGGQWSQIQTGSLLANYSIGAPRFINKPNGGVWSSKDSSKTGAITIVLPANLGNTMVSMWVDVYRYDTNTSFSAHIGGYAYTNSTWTWNSFATVYGADYKVRLGHNGTSFVIYIGETNTTWPYPQVAVRDILIGYETNEENWRNSISITWSTSFSNVTWGEGTTDGKYSHKAWTSKNFNPSNYLPTTTKYAASSSVGGAATSAAKLTNTSAIGSATNPVYFTSGGVPTACTYSLNKTVPSDAVFTDTNTWRPVGTGSTDACPGNGSVRYMRVYNSSNVAGSSTVTFDDLAKQHYACGMIYPSSGGNPTGANQWVHGLSMAWTDNTNTSWISQIAIGVGAGVGMWYRTTSGTIVGRGWYRVLDSDNSSVALDGQTLTVKINGTSKSLTNTNTWRGIQDNLTSSANTTESLSAKQGYLLANGSARDNTKLPLAGGTMTGQILGTINSGSWHKGRDFALLRHTGGTGYRAIWSMKTTNGSWEFGHYNANNYHNIPLLTYITDTLYTGSTATTTYQMKFPLDSGTIALTKNIPSSLPASDVYAWAKAATKPSYTLDEVSDGSTRKLSNCVIQKYLSATYTTTSQKRYCDFAVSVPNSVACRITIQWFPVFDGLSQQFNECGSATFICTYFPHSYTKVGARYVIKESYRDNNSGHTSLYYKESVNTQGVNYETGSSSAQMNVPFYIKNEKSSGTMDLNFIVIVEGMGIDGAYLTMNAISSGSGVGYSWVGGAGDMSTYTKAT